MLVTLKEILKIAEEKKKEIEEYIVSAMKTLEEKAEEDKTIVAEDTTAEDGENESESGKPKERVVNIQILQGESVMNIATKLETNKIIKNKGHKVIVLER